MKEENLLIKPVWALVCSSTSTDQNTNQVSIFNVIEEVTIGISGPRPADVFKNGVVVPLANELIALLQRADTSTKEIINECVVDVLDPFGISIGHVELPVKIEKDKQRSRINVKFNGFKVTSSGEYLYKISVKNTAGKLEEIISVPVHMKLSEPLAPNQTPKKLT